MLNGNNINDIKKMESEIRSLQESFKTSINTFSQNVQNVPNAVMEIKKITSLFDNSKKRGDIGEIHLEMIISSILPKEMYEMQSSENNFRYDCKITTSYKEYIIDAKFPLDNY
jgi:DNA anti-recombination protein RmuC